MPAQVVARGDQFGSDQSGAGPLEYRAAAHAQLGGKLMSADVGWDHWTVPVQGMIGDDLDADETSSVLAPVALGLPGAVGAERPLEALGVEDPAAVITPLGARGLPDSCCASNETSAGRILNELMILEMSRRPRESVLMSGESCPEQRMTAADLAEAMEFDTSMQ